MGVSSLLPTYIVNLPTSTNVVNILDANASTWVAVGVAGMRGQILGADAAVVFDAWYINCPAPGVGNTITFTVWNSPAAGGGFAATSLAVTISGTNTSGNSGALSTTVQPGDVLQVRATFSSGFTLTGSPISWCTRRTSTTGALASYPMTQFGGQACLAGTAGWLAPFSGGYLINTNSYIEESVVWASAGSFNLMYVNMPTVITGANVTVTLTINGSATALTLSIIAGTGGGHVNLGSPVTVNKGDLVVFAVTNGAGASASAQPQIGVMFTPTNAGECVYGYGQNTNGQEYGWAAQQGTTESNYLTPISAACTVKNLYNNAYLGTSVPTYMTAGDIVTFAIRKNGAATALIASGTAPGLAVLAINDTTDTVAFAQGDNITVGINATTAAMAATISTTIWGVCLYLPPSTFDPSTLPFSAPDLRFPERQSVVGY